VYFVIGGYGDTIVASNPFDDSPAPSRGPQGQQQGPPGMPPQGPPGGPGGPPMMRMGCPPGGPPQSHMGPMPPQSQWNGPPKPPIPPIQSGKVVDRYFISRLIWPLSYTINILLITKLLER
jgi:hypothetical protein